MKLSSLNEFKGKEVFVEWVNGECDIGKNGHVIPEYISGVMEDVEKNAITVSYTTREEEKRTGLLRISLEDLVTVENHK